jgi:hypothetical protein
MDSSGIGGPYGDLNSSTLEHSQNISLRVDYSINPGSIVEGPSFFKGDNIKNQGQ